MSTAQSLREFLAAAAASRPLKPLRVQGDFPAAKAAEPFNWLLGREGLSADKWPALNQLVSGHIGYHVRTDGHDVTDFDWARYLAFADRHLRPTQAVEKRK
jgi:hypothetical protein